MRTDQSRAPALLLGGALLASTCVLPAASTKTTTGGGGSGGSGTSSSSTTSSTSSASSSSTTTSSTSSSSSSGAVPCAGQDAGGVAPHLIMTVGTGTTFPTGYSAQRHLVYSPSTGKWWIFAVDSAMASVLRYAFSDDFATWTPGTLPLTPGTSDGRTFSVDLLHGMSQDVVEIAVAYPSPPSITHLRAILSPSAASLDAIGTGQLYAGDAGTVDSAVAATTVTPDGYVVHASGWEAGTPGGMSAWLSGSRDVGGTTWSPAWTFKSFNPQETVFGRALVSIGDGDVLAIRGVSGNLYSEHYSGGTWEASAVNVFPTMGAGDPNSWSVCVADRARAIRFNQATSAFDHYSYVEGTGWMSSTGLTNAPAPPTGSGVFAAADGQDVALFLLSSTSSNGTILGLTWTNGTWSNPSDLVACSGSNCQTRNYLAGYSIAQSHQVGLIWTEGAGAGPYDIRGALVCVP